jgi:signal transduction histidine kinase
MLNGSQDPSRKKTMSGKRSSNVSFWTALRENARLAVMYGLGAMVVGMLWWPLALVYLGYCVLSLLLLIALICPYCCNYHTRSCPDAYHVLSIFKPKKGRKFADQFSRYIYVTFPAWFVPPAVGLYLLITDFSWLTLALVGLFALVGFVVVPYLARDVCATCKNARNCPRGSGRFMMLRRERQGVVEGVTMGGRLRRWVAPPVFEGDEERTRVAGLLNVITFIVFGLVAIYTAVTLITAPDIVGLVVEGTMMVMALTLRYLMRRGHVRLASFVLSILLWLLISVGTYLYGGLLGSGLSSFFGVALIAGLLLGGRAAVTFAVLSILSTTVMLVTELLGVAPPPPGYITPAYRWAEFSTTILGVGSLFYLVIRSLEKALERARRNEREAIEASNFKSQLIARISHELRTPIGAVLGLTEMLEDFSVCGELSPKQRGITKKIVRNSHRLNRLVAGLLDQSRFESGSIKLEVATFSPRDIVAGVVALLRPTVESRGLLLKTDVADDLPDAAVSDPDRVEQILYNLVENAIKFTKAGSIDVRAFRSHDGRWAMQVADTGIGIPAEAQEYVFDPFRQVDESVTREYGGIGLGLAIVRQLTTLMGGEVTLESEIGKGSTVTVVLPLEPVGEGENVKTTCVDR